MKALKWMNCIYCSYLQAKMACLTNKITGRQVSVKYPSAFIALVTIWPGYFNHFCNVWYFLHNKTQKLSKLCNIRCVDKPLIYLTVSSLSWRQQYSWLPGLPSNLRSMRWHYKRPQWDGSSEPSCLIKWGHPKVTQIAEASEIKHAPFNNVSFPKKAKQKSQEAG